ncbi:MAG: SpoIIE family protein phosphatase [Caldilineales bacterium]
MISVPILGEKGEFEGALAGMFRLGESRVSSLYASIVRLRIGQSGNTYVLDRDGTILYDSSFTRIGAKLELPAQASSDIQGTATRTTDPDGNDIIASFAPIPGTGWTLVTEDDWATATRDTQSYANSLVILLALGTVLPALGVALLIRTQNAEMLERERDAQELRVAWLIQERLLPGAPPMLPGWNVDVFYKPHPASGGDFYDFYLMPDGSLALMLGHANAKGLEAAHVIDTVRAALRSAAQLRLPPGKALTHANALVCPELHGEACVSAIYAMLHPPTGRLMFASAGSIPPWISANAATGDLTEEGVSLGQEVGSEYGQRSLTIQPGQCALILSAGLFKARRPNGALFDLASLRAIVTEPDREADGMVEALAGQLKSYTGMKGLPPEDVTVLIVQRHPDARPADSAYPVASSPRRQLGPADFGVD